MNGKAKDKRPLYLALLDLTKAYDKVVRMKLFRKLKKTGAQGRIYNVITPHYRSEGRRQGSNGVFWGFTILTIHF